MRSYFNGNISKNLRLFDGGARQRALNRPSYPPAVRASPAGGLPPIGCSHDRQPTRQWPRGRPDGYGCQPTDPFRSASGPPPVLPRLLCLSSPATTLAALRIRQQSQLRQPAERFRPGAAVPLRPFVDGGQIIRLNAGVDLSPLPGALPSCPRPATASSVFHRTLINATQFHPPNQRRNERRPPVGQHRRTP